MQETPTGGCKECGRLLIRHNFSANLLVYAVNCKPMDEKDAK